jgi:hypothetical protein
LLLDWKLFNRKLVKTGFNLTIFWLIVPIFLFLISKHLIERGTNSAWILIFLFAAIFQVSNAKLHRDFLITNIGLQKIRAIRILRNLLLAIPLLMMLIISGKYQQSLALTIIAISAAFLKVPQTNARRIPTPYRKYPFEFITGFRRFFWIWLILPPSIWLGSAYNNYSIALFALSIVMLVQIQFYNVQEPLWYVWNESKTPSEFLFHKFKIGTICSTIANTIPAFFVGAILPESIWMVASMVMLALVMTIFTILSKYAWIPNQISTLQGILFASNLFFPPLLLFTIPYLYKKAENNLKNYLV